MAQAYRIERTERRFARLVVAGGIGLTLGASTAAVILLQPTTVSALASLPARLLPDRGPEPSTYVAIERMVLPLAEAEGRLLGYATIDASIECAEGRRDWVKHRIPAVRHAVNMVAWKTPLTSQNHHGLPDLEAVRRLMEQEARRALGAEAVRSVRITGALPA